MSYSFSIIGCRHGHIGDFIQEMLALGHTCAGIYETGDQTLALQFSKQYGIPLVDNLETVLAPSVDLVGSSAINSEKIDILELCDKYGKHVMFDKPVVTSGDGLQRLEKIIKQGRIQVGMLLTERFRSSVKRLKQSIDDGELGEIVSVATRKPHRLSPAIRPLWHFSQEQNGGIIVDLLIHDFDLLRWLTNQEIVEVSGIKSKTILPEYADFYDAASVQVLMDGGAQAQLYADWHAPEQCWSFGDCRLFVCGTKGSAELRLCGDPSVGMEELLFIVTEKEPFHRVELHPNHLTITEDFLLRMGGQAHLITHHDLLQASKATIEANERVVINHKFRDNI